jgi:hypothetical protein
MHHDRAMFDARLAACVSAAVVYAAFSADPSGSWSWTGPIGITVEIACL